MTEMQAAIGRLQLEKLDNWVRLRRKNSEYLTQRLSFLPWVMVPSTGGDFYHSCYKLYLTLDANGFRDGWNRDRIVAEITAQGMPCLAGICPEMYRELAFERAGLAPASSLPVAKDVGARGMLLLVHPTITFEELEAYADVVVDVLQEAMSGPGFGGPR